MYLVHTDQTREQEEGKAGNKEEMPPFLLCSSDMPVGPEHTADGPSLEVGVESSLPFAASRNIIFHQQALQLLCI